MAEPPDPGPIGCGLLCPLTCNSFATNPEDSTPERLKQTVKLNSGLFVIPPICLALPCVAFMGTTDEYHFYRDRSAILDERGCFSSKRSRLTGVTGATVYSSRSEKGTYTYGVSLRHSAGSKNLTCGTDNMNVQAKRDWADNLNAFLGLSMGTATLNPVQALVNRIAGGGLQSAPGMQSMAGYGGIGAGAGAGAGGGGPMTLARFQELIASIPPPRDFVIMRTPSAIAEMLTVTLSGQDPGLKLAQGGTGVTVLGFTGTHNPEETSRFTIGDVIVAVNPTPTAGAATTTGPVAVTNVMEVMTACQRIGPPRLLTFRRGHTSYEVVMPNARMGLSFTQQTNGCLVTGFDSAVYVKPNGPNQVAIGDMLIAIAPGPKTGGTAATAAATPPATAPWSSGVPSAAMAPVPAMAPPAPAPAPAAAADWFAPTFNNMMGLVERAMDEAALVAGWNAVESVMQTAPPGGLTSAMHDRIISVGGSKRSELPAAWTEAVATSFGATLRTFASKSASSP